MSRGKWTGKRRHQITAEEVGQILQRYDARDRVEDIAEAIGCSSGMVSQIAIENGRRRRGGKAKPVNEAIEAPRGVVAFEFRGVEVHRDGEELNLTELWRAGGADEYKRPSRWFDGAGKEFSEYVFNVSGEAIKHGERGRGGSTWANRHVALAYAAYLEPALHMHVQQVYFAYMDGRLGADSPETEALLDATQAAAAEANPDMMRLITSLPETVAARVIAELVNNGTIRRRHLNGDTKREHLGTVARFFNGDCPCCGLVPVVRDGQTLPGAHYDHATGNRAKNRPCETWLVCAKCNKYLESHRDERSGEFDFYQKRRRQYVRQLAFDFGTEAAD